MAEVKGTKSRKVVVTDPNEAVGAIVEAKGVPGLEEPLKIRNNVGSSSGAGSGVFHQYRLGRRKEEERLKAMAEENAKEKADREWEEQRLARIAEEERKRTKKAAKRNKRKRTGGNKGGKKANGAEEDEPEEKRRKIQGPERPPEVTETGDMEIKKEGEDAEEVAEEMKKEENSVPLEPQEAPKVKHVNAIKIVEGFF